MSHGLFPALVKLEPISHKYHNQSGDEYHSVTRLLKDISEKFEDTFAYKNATEEKRAEWKAKGAHAANEGTRIHNALEMFADTRMIKDSDLELEEAIRKIDYEYRDYHKLHNEICLYNDK